MSHLNPVRFSSSLFTLPIVTVVIKATRRCQNMVRRARRVSSLFVILLRRGMTANVHSHLQVSHSARCDDGLDHPSVNHRCEICDVCYALLETRTIQSVSMPFRHSFPDGEPRDLTTSIPTCMRLVPVVGMLCGNAIGAILVSQSYVLKELESVVLSLWHPDLAEREPISRDLSSVVKIATRRRRCSRSAHHASRLVARLQLRHCVFP